MITLVKAGQSRSNNIVSRSYKGTYKNEEQTGFVVLVRDSKEKRMNQFNIDNWPDWMPRTDDKFNTVLHKARSWQAAEKALSSLTGTPVSATP